MITPPFSAQCFYTALLEKPVAVELMKTVSPTFAKDIDQVVVTSLDLSSDVEAAVECTNGADQLIQVFTDTEKVASYNPLFLPNPKNFEESIEVDSDGDIAKISGFTNPFVTANYKYSMPDNPEMIDASICYKQFELPSLSEALKQDKKVLLS